MPRADKAKSTGRRKPRPSRKPAVERGLDVPHWLPAGTCWDKLPENVREAVSRFVAPAYRRFVLDAPSEIERSIGATLVHLMWLKLCGQLQLAQAAADPHSLEALLQNPASFAVVPVWAAIEGVGGPRPADFAIAVALAAAAATFPATGRADAAASTAPEQRSRFTAASFSGGPRRPRAGSPGCHRDGTVSPTAMSRKRT
jgi:hypothetical protein